MSSTPTIPRIDDRKNFDAKVFAQDVGSSNEYCQRAKRDLYYTDWGREYIEIMQMVDVEADAELRNIDLPASAPPFDYRVWFIARARANQTKRYCLSKKSEIDLDIVVSLILLRHELNRDPAHAEISGKNSRPSNLASAAALLGFCNL